MVHVCLSEGEDGEALLQRLYDHSTRPERVYRHNWRVGDLLFWVRGGDAHVVQTACGLKLRWVVPDSAPCLPSVPMPLCPLSVAGQPLHHAPGHGLGAAPYPLPDHGHRHGAPLSEPLGSIGMCTYIHT